MLRPTYSVLPAPSYLLRPSCSVLPALSYLLYPVLLRRGLSKRQGRSQYVQVETAEACKELSVRCSAQVTIAYTAGWLCVRETHVRLYREVYSQPTPWTLLIGGHESPKWAPCLPCRHGVVTY